MKIALDLGTTTGYAAALGTGDVVISGVWKLAPGKHENWASRFRKFRTSLDNFVIVEEVEGVWYEAVRGHKGTDAAHIYGGFLATLMAWCDEREVPCVGVPVGTIKKFATGRGNAGKAEMIAAANERFECETDDDNEADAIALLYAVITGETD